MMNPAQSNHELTVTTPSDREIVLTRVFDAPRQLVWDAFTKPELVQRWLFGPDGWTMPYCSIDLRPGGTYRYEMLHVDYGDKMGMGGVYREVKPPDRIVQVERFDEAWYPGQALVTTTFSEHLGTTTVTLTLEYESREARDMVLKSGMTGGIALSYDRLARLIGEEAV